MPAAKTVEAELERRRKISASTKGVPRVKTGPVSDETRVKLSEINTARWAGMSPTEKTAICDKISLSLTQHAKAEDPNQKRCKTCEKDFDRSEFTADVRNRDGLFATCKGCNNVRAKTWAANNRGLVRGYQRNRYNVDFDALWEAQKGLCVLCEHPMLPTGQEADSVVVDHDHACCPPGVLGDTSCGKCVRGLLHNSCNRFLGLLEKKPDLALSAIKYLAHWHGRESK